MRAIVTDVHLRSAVAGLRGLGRAGVSALALAPRPSAAGLWSRYAHGRETAPDPVTDREGFMDAVARLTRRHSDAVVYPGCEDSLDALLDAPPGLGIRLPYGSLEAVRLVRDKRLLPQLAATAGLPALRTLAEGPRDEVAAQAVAVPCIVKVTVPGGHGRSAMIARTPAELSAILGGISDRHPVLVQELATGPLSAVSLVIAPGGRVVGRFQQLALRTWPEGAGPSALAVGVSPDEELVTRIAGMLRAVGFSGMAQIQLVGTPAGPAPIDVNPRFYGSLPLALASGVNLPALWHGVATGRRPDGGTAYRVGVRYRALASDVGAALHGDRRRALSREPRPCTGAIWSADDPLASVLLGVSALNGGLRRQALAGRGRRVAGAPAVAAASPA